MKLNETRPFVESSGTMPEQFFSIKDTGMIFDILRSKMYSNPILAICREITCNARDAHREVGKPELPVQIMLPNVLDRNYRIKDLGPGISPDRMSNIFIQYTASTKRNDNVQTGGFGLGAKTPFAYSDSFAITTVFKGIKYQYNCYIDETKVGKLALLSQSETTEPSGTEIIIPVQPKDSTLFVQWTEHACRHWEVKPTIKGGSVHWQNNSVVLNGSNWAITTSSGYYDRQVKMIIDGIEYPLAIDTLRTFADTKLIDACTGHVLLYFNIGELTLSASREQIYLDDKTKALVRSRLELMHKDIKKILVDKIDMFPNLWQANLYYRKELNTVFNSLNFFGKLEWKGCPLSDGWVNVDCPAFVFTKGKWSRKHGTDPSKLTRSRMSSLHFEDNSALFINDLPIKEPTPRHMKKAFEDDPTLQKIQIICPTDTMTEGMLNKSLHLDQMAPRRLSEITKASGRAYTAPSSRLLVFKFDPSNTQFRQVSYSSIDEDANDKVLCLLRKDASAGLRSPVVNKNIVTPSAMNSISAKNDKVSFYGVDVDTPSDRVEEEFGEFETLEKYIDEKILDNTKINYVEMKFVNTHHFHVDEATIKWLPQLKAKITATDSIFLQRAEAHQRMKSLHSSDIGLLNLFESFKGEITKSQLTKYLTDNPDCNLDAINKKYMETYPLLSVINHYQYGNIIDHIAQYVNLIDSIKN